MGKKLSITEKITNDLRLELIDGVYYADAILTEQQISAKYGCSKTPARETLGILCSEGLLEKLPNKGYLIKRYTMKELENLLEYRSILERAIVSLAMERASVADISRVEMLCDKTDALSHEEIDKQCVMLNREFHIELAKLSKNRYLVTSIANVMDQVRVAMAFDRSRERLMAGHREILAMIKRHDSQGAEQWTNRFMKYFPNNLVGRFLDE